MYHSIVLLIPVFFSTYVSVFFIIHYSVFVTACKKKLKDRKHQEILSASEDNAESSEEGDKKPTVYALRITYVMFCSSQLFT